MNLSVGSNKKKKFVIVITQFSTKKYRFGWSWWNTWWAWIGWRSRWLLIFTHRHTHTANNECKNKLICNRSCRCRWYTRERWSRWNTRCKWKKWYWWKGWWVKESIFQLCKRMKLLYCNIYTFAWPFSIKGCLSHSCYTKKKKLCMHICEHSLIW